MVKRFDRGLLPASPDLSFETALWEAGLRLVAGIDEAGRGALAGPVAAAVVIFPAGPQVQDLLPGVRDSKQMTAPEREHWAVQIKRLAQGYGVGFAEPAEIDAQGIVAATCLAVERALQALQIRPEHLLVDFLRLPRCPIPQTPLVKGDQRSLSIAAASVLAKTSRDALMVQLNREYPGYNLDKHKGYGTAVHLQALAQSGPSPVHRRSFAPVRVSVTKEKNND